MVGLQMFFLAQCITMITRRNVRSTCSTSLLSNINFHNLKDYKMSRLMTKPTKWPLRPAKTQISLGTRQVWSESWLCAPRIDKDPMLLHADSEDSDQTGRIVWPGKNSNSTEIWCLSSLSASLIKIRSKLNRLCSGQGQIWCFSVLKGK